MTKLKFDKMWYLMLLLFFDIEMDHLKRKTLKANTEKEVNTKFHLQDNVFQEDVQQLSTVTSKTLHFLEHSISP